MFDLEEQLRRWRQETEATLAFDDDEIDELEDHLRLSVETSMEKGLSPEQAWNRSIANLGLSPALALEFAKSKLMPALFHLLKSWGWSALLLFLFGITFSMGVEKEWLHLDKDWQGYVFGVMAWLSFSTILILLPDKSHKNAVLLGLGNAFCLLPFLHLLFYNRLTDGIVGVDWSRMAASFGWLPLSLGLIGILFLNAWWWKRNRTSPEKLPTMLAVAGTIVLLLALSPFCSELVGNLSLRELYSLPTVHQITQTGEARNDFLKFEFCEVLVESLVYITTMVPFALMAVTGAGIVLLQYGSRALKTKEPSADKIFPATRDLPWIMTLVSSGIFWMLAGLIEPAQSEQVRGVERSIAQPASSHGGIEIVVLFYAALFLIAGYELTRRLRQSNRVRPFYASMLLAVESAVFVIFVGVTLLPNLLLIPGHDSSGRHDLSSQPAWLSWILGLSVLFLAVYQARLIWKKSRSGICEPSIWKFDGKGLVQFGLLLGLTIACAGTILWMVAMDMAYISVIYISALIAWGNSIAKPVTDHFNPQDYGTSGHLSFWAMASPGYLALCLVFGLGIAVALSGLEFIRFNGFRFYKVRKAARELPNILAVNE